MDKIEIIEAAFAGAIIGAFLMFIVMSAIASEQKLSTQPYIYIDYQRMAEVNTSLLLNEINGSTPQWRVFGEVVNGDLVLAIPFNQKGVAVFKRIEIIDNNSNNLSASGI